VIGAYHSHPESVPIPSATDLAEAAGSGFVYVIVFPGSSAMRPEIRAYRFDAGNFQPVEIVPVA
jgi:proteasome lid subunit RPN8/RPN11